MCGKTRIPRDMCAANTIPVAGENATLRHWLLCLVVCKSGDHEKFRSPQATSTISIL